eukprot:50592-Chlamydomonas_euryale.AAC.2
MSRRGGSLKLSHGRSAAPAVRLMAIIMFAVTYWLWFEGLGFRGFFMHGFSIRVCWPCFPHLGERLVHV